MLKFASYIQTNTKIRPPSLGWLRAPASRLCDVGAMSLAASVALSSPAASQALAQSREKVLHSFKEGSNDGGIPYGGLVADAAGNLYGTAFRGCNANYGLVFRIAVDGKKTVLHCFTSTDGSGPYAGMILDKSGNLFGTTYGGGVNNAGAVFKLAPDGTETALYSFPSSGDDGDGPIATVVEYKGSLYGATTGGGANNGGVFYKVTQAGVETVIHSFAGVGSSNDGSQPRGTPIVDNDGNMYGTTTAGGASNSGAVYKIDSKGNESLLYSFKGGNDGNDPASALIRDKAGNLYGTTQFGGANNFGTIFELKSDGTEVILYTFNGATDGKYPIGGLLADQTGTLLYGTANYGGPNGNGTVFKLSTAGAFTVLQSFTGGNDGGQPYWVSLVRDSTFAKGYLYGTTAYGGKDNVGVVFRVKK